MKRKWTDESIYDKKTIERVLYMSDEEYVEAFS